MTVDELLQIVPEGEKREKVKSLLDADNTLSDYFMRQADYSREFDRLRKEYEQVKAGQAALEEAADQGRKWAEWYGFNFGSTTPDDLTKLYRESQANPQAASPKTEGAPPKDADEDVDVVVPRLRQEIAEMKAKAITREQLEAELNQKLQSATRETEDKLGRSVDLSQKISDLRRRYEADFPGENLDAMSVPAAMSKYNLTEPAIAYQIVTAEKYRAKHEKDVEKRIADAATKAREDAKREFESRTPPDSVGGASGFTPVSAADVKDPVREALKGSKLGDGKLSKVIAPFLARDLREGKFEGAER